MKRREFITLLGGAAAAWISPPVALAQDLDKRPRRIAYLGGSSRMASGRLVEAFPDGMRTHGYVEGRNFEIDYRWAEGHLKRISTLAEELIRSNPDLVLAGTVQAAVAASDATKTIPIVCPLLADPVQLGLIKSDARPGGNVTGLLLFVEGLPGKQLELVFDLIPGATMIGLVINPDNLNNVSQRRELEVAAAAKGIKIVSVEKHRFDLPDAGERTGRCGHRASGLGILQPTRKIGGVGNGGAVADRVRLPRARGGWRPY